ncbi:MAG: hypothetical protein DRP86_08515 [Candidatus Neomarinimicrobiota bacterium]|nr:MAG: hypothetical protein DRP86_08515 [Candidatus Neomarinimicrobiota bacterium]
MLTGCLDLSQDTQPEGTLTGKVTIGPLCPVEPCDLTEEEIFAAYEARKILIYNRDTTVVLWKAGINHDSTYTVPLVQGSYIVDIDTIGIDHSSDVPALVNIVAGNTTRLDIDIDTGIR